MALCKFCGKYTDQFEWPEEYREYARPKLCFECYKQDPSRGILIPGLEDSLPIEKEEMKTSSEEREDDSTTTEEDDPDGSEDIFPDEDDGCQTEDDDYEEDPDDH